MSKKIREYVTYRKNKKLAKRELARLGAATLGLFSKISENSATIVDFIVKLSNETEGLEGEKLFQKILDELK